jgi:DNA-binding response OmpR family regulator
MKKIMLVDDDKDLLLLLRHVLKISGYSVNHAFDHITVVLFSVPGKRK